MIKFEFLTDFWQGVIRKLGMTPTSEYNRIKAENYQLQLSLQDLYHYMKKDFRANSMLMSPDFFEGIDIQEEIINPGRYLISVKSLHYEFYNTDIRNIEHVEFRDYIFEQFSKYWIQELKLSWNKIFDKNLKQIIPDRYSYLKR